jgi:hypothetical protein
MHIHRRNLEIKRVQEQERQRAADSSLETNVVASSMPMEA